jgi:hypothetical protein
MLAAALLKGKREYRGVKNELRPLFLTPKRRFEIALWKKYMALEK